MSNQQQQQPQQQPPPPPQQQQQQGAGNQQLTQQHRTDIGQATGATSRSLPSYETVPNDGGIGNDAGIHSYYRTDP